jgi:hypothetical protein
LVGKPYQKRDIKHALVNAGIRKAFYERSLTWRVEQTPGKFVPSIDRFSDWERKLINFLSGIPGVTGIPLHYVIREESWHYNMGDHVEALAALASLEGPNFIADSRVVCQCIRGYVPNIPFDYWYGTNTCGNDGRLLMTQLRQFYSRQEKVALVATGVGRMKDDCLYDDHHDVVSLSLDSREGATENKHGSVVSMTIGTNQAADANAVTATTTGVAGQVGHNQAMMGADRTDVVDGKEPKRCRRGGVKYRAKERERRAELELQAERQLQVERDLQAERERVMERERQAEREHLAERVRLIERERQIEREQLVALEWQQRHWEPTPEWYTGPTEWNQLSHGERMYIRSSRGFQVAASSQARTYGNGGVPPQGGRMWYR